MKIINRIINRTLRGQYAKEGVNTHKLSTIQKIICIIFPLISIPTATAYLPTYTAALIALGSLFLWVILAHAIIMEKHFNLITQDK